MEIPFHDTCKSLMTSFHKTLVLLSEYHLVKIYLVHILCSLGLDKRIVSLFQMQRKNPLTWKMQSTFRANQHVELSMVGFVSR